MSRDTLAIVQSKEVNGIELQMALQCAPLITGLKTSNLLNIAAEEFCRMQEIIKDSHISWHLLLESPQRFTVLLYHKESLERYLEQPGGEKAAGREGI